MALKSNKTVWKLLVRCQIPVNFVFSIDDKHPLPVPFPVLKSFRLYFAAYVVATNDSYFKDSAF